MLGDIVVNNGNNGGATAVRPVTGGYGSSSFGVPKTTPQSVTQPTPQPIQLATQPGTPAVKEQTEPVIAEQPAMQSPVAATKQAGAKAPLVLTLVGVIIFIGGVSGLFVYALSGS